MSRRSLARRILRGAYFTLCNTLLLCLLLETGWRVFRMSRSESTDVVAASPASVPYTLHPYFQTVFAPAPGVLVGPHLAGWIVQPSEAAELKGRFRVLFLGGSTSARKYPQFVREELEKSVGPVTIYMLGFDWHSSLHTLYKIWTYADDIQPDLTIVLEGVNDFYRGFTPPDKSLPVYRSDYSHWSAALNPFWLRGRSRYDGRDVFYARPAGRFEVFETRDDSPLGWLREGLRESTLLRDMHIDFGGASEIPDGRIPPAPEEVLLRALPDYERNLRNIALSCQVKGLPVLFLTMPYTTAARQSLTGPGGVFTNDGIHNLSLEDFGRGMDRFNAAVLELRDEPRAFVLPLADELRAQVGEKQVFLDEVHLSAAGQLLEAQIVTRFIIEHELLKKPRN